MELWIHGLTFGSTANGPGRRHVVHTQGCSLGCPGCFNPTSHTAETGERLDTTELAHRLLDDPCDGVTISGGEPFQQPHALYALITALRAHSPDLSILVFSGYSIEELRAQTEAPKILRLIDVLVDGRFQVKEMAEGGLRGSANQRVHLLSTRHTPDELADRSTEILIRPDGTIVMTGFPSGKLVGAIKRG